MLANCLRGSRAKQLITQIQMADGKITSNLTEINDTFRDYYSNLYASELQNDNMQMYNFLDNLKIPELSPDDRERLDRPITKEETELAVSGKSPGPDGFPAEFFRLFSSLLVPHLSLVLSDSFKQNKLPVSFSEATITLIAKKEKDPTQCSSYRPISLLNVDVKILAKIMAHRVENVLPSVISTDQNGFIKNRHSY